jgi:hypothetical protein
VQARVVKQEELLDRNTAEAQRALAEMKAEMDEAKARHEVLACFGLVTARVTAHVTVV